MLDAATGALRYTVPLPALGSFPSVGATLARDASLRTMVAYCNDGYALTAVGLGDASATILWTQTGGAFLLGDSTPTVVGGSIVLASPAQYFAFDRRTGAQNHFYSGDILGSAGVTVAYDEKRRQFYIRADYSSALGPQLSAYRYESNDSITLLWQKAEPIFYLGGTVAIGPNGQIYDVNEDEIAELSPDGSTLRVIPGSFVGGGTPALSRNVLWAYSETNTFAYNLKTLAIARVFDGSDAFRPEGVGAFTPGAFVLEHGDFSFDFYLSR